MSASLFYQNWHNIFTEISYWGGNQDSPLTHLWFSSIIGQFSIVWPLIVIFALKFKKKCKNIVLNISIGLAILSGILQIIYFDLYGFNKAYYGTDTRIIALMASSILACLILDEDFNIKALDSFKYKKLAISSLIVGISILWIITDVENPFLFKRLIFGNIILWSILIYLCLRLSIFSIPKAFILDNIALMSFQLYLWHWPVIVIGRDYILNDFIILILAFVISFMIYLIIEKKNIFQKKFVTKQIALLAITLAVITLWKPNISNKHGYEPLVSQHITNNRVLVVGDSWSRYLGIGLENTSKKRDYAIYNYGVGGFGTLNPEFYVYSDGNNLESTEYNQTYLERWHKTVESFKPNAVLITLGNFDQASQIIDGETIRVGNPKFDELYKNKLVEIIDGFISKDLPVIVTNIVDNARDTMDENSIKLLNKVSDDMSKNLNSVMEKYKDNQNVLYFDLDKILSPTEIAPTKTSDGSDIYDETNHPTEETCTYIGGLLFDEFDKFLNNK
ncbi:MAG: acyltransferase family protein [Sarcina sp.]